MSTPRERFQQSEHLAALKNMAGSLAFAAACDYALLQLQSEMPGTTFPGSPTDPYIGLDANSQMAGARRVIEILKNLHEVPKPQIQQKPHKLSYD